MNPVSQLITFLVRRSTKEHSAAVQTAATLLGVIIFMGGIPALVFFSGTLLDKSLFQYQRISLTVSIICFIIGLPWMLSAVFLQLVKGKGTPVPIVPTKHFLQNGPYRYVRNPMMLGFFLYLIGWACIFNKAGAFLAAAAVITFLIAEVKIIEEAELEKRFGQAYHEYKKEIPFIFPKWQREKRSNENNH